MSDTLPSIADLIPHKAPMILIDRLVSVTADRVCAESRLAVGSLDDSGKGVSTAWSLEIVAQACAALIGHAHRDKGYHEGRLIKSPIWLFKQNHLPVDELLEVTATLEAASDIGLFLFNGEIKHNGQVLATGQLSILAR